MNWSLDKVERRLNRRREEHILRPSMKERWTFWIIEGNLTQNGQNKAR